MTMTIIGIIVNYITLILFGQYNGELDGNLIEEDPAVYDLAFQICTTIGTCI